MYKFTKSTEKRKKKQKWFKHVFHERENGKGMYIRKIRDCLKI